MPISSHWNRRQLLQAAASLTALHSLPLPAMGPLLRYAYAASAAGEGSIHVFAIQDSHWTLVQVIPAQSPSSLALHPFGRVLYVANEVAETDGLPRGSMEAFALDSGNGTLSLLIRRPLSLSATSPRHLALSSDGRQLIVQAFGGGVTNLFSLDHEGHPSRVSTIHKHTGAGVHPQYQQSAHPYACVSAGKTLVVSDLGADSLSFFSLQEGQLTLTSRMNLAAGSGPGQIALHPAGRLLFAANHIGHSITTLTLDPDPKVVRTTPLAALQNTLQSSMLLHPSGRLLYTAIAGERGTTLQSWRVKQETGFLSLLAETHFAHATLHLNEATASDDSLYLLQQKPEETSGAILHVSLSSSGLPGVPRVVAEIPQPRFLVFL